MILGLAEQLRRAQSNMAAKITEDRSGRPYQRKHAPRRKQGRSLDAANAVRATKVNETADRIEALIAEGVTVRMYIMHELNITDSQATRAIEKLCLEGRIQRTGRGQYATGKNCRVAIRGDA